MQVEMGSKGSIQIFLFLWWCAYEDKGRKLYELTLLETEIIPFSVWIFSGGYPETNRKRLCIELSIFINPIDICKIVLSMETW